MLTLFRKDRVGDAATAVYTSIVAQSRHPEHYLARGVPDSVTGRFDMVSLHVALVLHRLRRDPEAARFSQALFDQFFRDMDRSLREMGVGDLAVPRRINRMAEMFYGLLASVGAALDNSDRSELVAALSRNIYETEPNLAAALAEYCESQAATLDAQPAEAIVGGQISFARSAGDA